MNTYVIAYSNYSEKLHNNLSCSSQSNYNVPHVIPDTEQEFYCGRCGGPDKIATVETITKAWDSYARFNPNIRKSADSQARNEARKQEAIALITGGTT